MYNDMSYNNNNNNDIFYVKYPSLTSCSPTIHKCALLP